jgi:hypothetical protein
MGVNASQEGIFLVAALDKTPTATEEQWFG